MFCCFLVFLCSLSCQRVGTLLDNLFGIEKSLNRATHLHPVAEWCAARLSFLKLHRFYTPFFSSIITLVLYMIGIGVVACVGRVE